MTEKQEEKKNTSGHGIKNAKIRASNTLTCSPKCSKEYNSLSFSKKEKMKPVQVGICEYCNNPIYQWKRGKIVKLKIHDYCQAVKDGKEKK